MARNRLLGALAVLGGCLLAALLPGLPAGLRLGLMCLACGIGGSVLLLLAPPPWPARRRAWRVRYHAPDPAALDPARLGRGLTTLARYVGWVDVVWQRRAGVLTLWLESAASADALLPPLIVQLLPEVTLDPVSAPEPVGVALTGRWPLLRGGGGAIPLFDDPHRLLDESLFAGDLEVRLHLATGGGAVLVHGTPVPAVDRQGWRRWRGPDRWRRWLFSHYRLWDPWPGGQPPRLSIPATNELGTAALDSRRGPVVPLPPTYVPPTGDGPRLRLGVATADDRPVEIRADPSAGAEGAAWRGHFGLLGERAETAATLTALITAARCGGISVVRLRSAPAPADGATSPAGPVYQIDLDNPGVSLHWNLLTAATPRTRAAADVTAALRSALADQAPLLGATLAQMGVVARSSGAGWGLLLDAARLATAHYYRALLNHGDSAARPPGLRTLYELLADPAALLDLAAVEAPAWAALDGRVGATLNAAWERLRALPVAGGRQVAAALCDRLVPVIRHPRLAPWWAGPLTAPGAVLDSTPGVLVGVDLPPDAEERTTLAACRYGIYLLACVIALAQARQAVGRAGPPVLVVLEEGGAWWRGALLGDYLPTLTAAGVAVLTTSARLPADPVSARLLTATATWWLHTLEPADQARLRPYLRAWGAPPDVLRAGLPSGVALLKWPAAAGSLVATVCPTHREERI